MFKSASWLVMTLVVSTIALPAHSLLAALQFGIEVGDPEHKVIDGPDDDGDVEISIKVIVKNTSAHDHNVELSVRGLDRDSFEVFEIFLSGVVTGGQRRALTGADYIKERRYKSIVTSQVKEVTVT